MPSLGELFGMLKGYARDAMPGGALNPETRPIAEMVDYASGAFDPQSRVSRDAQRWHKKTQAGLADQLAGKKTPEADYAYQQAMNMVGLAPLGMTAWHGSPHKFDKFSLDKIGTGEGAQAYGHGLYLAEAKDVAETYSPVVGAKYVTKSGADFKPQSGYEDAMLNLVSQYGDAATAIQKIGPNAPAEIKGALQRMIQEGVAVQPASRANIYKTDIPDEAVARFLDWDKKLSEQSPEARQAITKFLQEKDPALFKTWSENGALEHAPAGSWVPRTGQSAAEFSSVLQQQGIPGIRYLDGGSRSAGQGSSNFVVFDPEMIRILERNGQATGLQPWKPGEYRLRDLITN